MGKILTELWTKHRKEFLFCTGMICFLAAGLLVWALPEKPESLAAQLERAKLTELTERTGKKIKDATETPPAPESAVPNSADEMWFLYITGSVRTPGVYRLPPGSRLVHLVEAAGGMDGLADAASVNLAAPLEDGTSVHVPQKESTPTAELPPARNPANKAAARKPAEKLKSSDAVVNVNRATAEELSSLRGIGPVLAKNIVEYRRANGPFRSVDELLRVKGIGAKKLKGFRGRVVARP
jgi:competence protein ComEA